MKIKKLLTLIMIIALAGILSCDVDPEQRSDVESDDVIAKVEMGNEESIKFISPEPGIVIVSSILKAGAPVPEYDNVLEYYTELTGEPAPEELVHAVNHDLNEVEEEKNDLETETDNYEPKVAPDSDDSPLSSGIRAKLSNVGEGNVSSSSFKAYYCRGKSKYTLRCWVNVTGYARRVEKKKRNMLAYLNCTHGEVTHKFRYKKRGKWRAGVIENVPSGYVSFIQMAASKKRKIKHEVYNADDDRYHLALYWTSKKI